MTVPVRELPLEEHPARFRALESPPERLWIRGEVPRGPAVAIVGTRHPTPAGVRFAEGLAASLARAGIAILSGGAVGIDAAAHRGALSAEGVTMVVLPSGFGAEYPEKNRPLFDDVAERGGALLSSFPPGTQAMRFRFFARNAQLAALADALVVVESPFRSGARNAVKAARALRRPLLVVPGAPWEPQSEGCLLELRRGATLVRGADDVLEAIGRGAAPASPLPPPLRAPAGDPRQVPLFRTNAADPVAERVVAALARGPLHPDGLCLEAAVQPAELQASLLTLTLEGIVVSDPSGRVSLVRY